VLAVDSDRPVTWAVRLELGDRMSRRVHVGRLRGENGLDSQLAPSPSRNVAKRKPAPPCASAFRVLARARQGSQFRPD
jgi:hypothetical protein